MKAWLKNIYENKYKWLLLIPNLLVILALLQIGHQFYSTGDFVHRGVSLKGGSSITLNYDSSINIPALTSLLQQQFPQAGIEVRTISSAGQITTIIIESNVQETTEISLIQASINQKLGPRDMSVEIIGEALGKTFFEQTLVALLAAFLLMGLVVLVYFRTIIPSLAVIAAAFSDIVVTLAVFNLTGIKLTTAGIAAFLMLIGYSVDTDILLNSRVLKRHEGTIMDRIYSAIKTGLTMTFTTLSAILVALILVPSEVVRQIMIILFLGIMIDMIMTWIQNVAILRLYLERKSRP